MRLATSAALLALVACPVYADLLPAAVSAQLPPGYEVIGDASGRMQGGLGRDYLVVIARPDELAVWHATGTAPERPMLVIRARGNAVALIARNDHVILRADEGGQCDPFRDNDGALQVRRHGFTVEQGVACGEHWTYTLTFRLAAGGRILFDREMFESWHFNPDRNPYAEALVADRSRTYAADPRRPVTFKDYRWPTRTISRE